MKPATRNFENPYPQQGYGCGFHWKTPGLPVTIPTYHIIEVVGSIFLEDMDEYENEEMRDDASESMMRKMSKRWVAFSRFLHFETA
jgi:hypothetical protein